MDRRRFTQRLIGAAFLGLAPRVAYAALDGGDPPHAERQPFIDWMVAHRKEDAGFLGQRWDRLQALVQHKDVWAEKNVRGYLMTPREDFVTRANRERTYVWHYLDIGYGVTITGPHTVARMTSTLDVAPTDNVLEIGTGSGYQSAYLSNLTPHVHSIEIIPALFRRTRGVYDDLIARGYVEYAAIQTKNGDGYYGWEDAAPFDKIIVTCGIDHVPPPLLRQLKPGGIMVIPVGAPGAQHVLKITTEKTGDGVRVARTDIYNGAIIPFVPFRKLEGGAVVGSHSGKGGDGVD